MTIENKVLARVKKMLALGKDAAATEGERDNALRMAYNLLAKHNLSIEDLQADEVQEVRERQDAVVSADRWARSLAQSVAKLFFCRYFYMATGTSGKDRHCFVGKQSNAITARYMSEYLIASVKREASKRYKSPTSPEGRSFCVGTVDSVRRRVDEMLAADTDSTPGTAVALRSVRENEYDANSAWMQAAGLEVETRKARADNALRYGAFSDGRAFGKTVSLNQQVGATARPDLKRLS